MTAEGRCWICDRHAQVHWNMDDESIVVKCRVCGHYRASHDARNKGNGPARAILPYLAAHIRQRSEHVRFEVPPDWPELAANHANSTLSQRIRLLLEWIANHTPIGGHAEIYLEELAPMIDAIDLDQASFLLQHLHEYGFVTLRKIDVKVTERPPDSRGEKVAIQMRVAGWEAVSPVAGAGIAGTCFVAMSFAKELDDAFENGILPAVTDDCKFNIIRVDRVEHNDSISDRILADIRGAQFVVADFTGQRQGVYFEAGFAAGLGRVVIWTCRADEVGELHFDTRQRNHILWSTPADLRERLALRIKATVSLAPYLGPNS